MPRPDFTCPACGGRTHRPADTPTASHRCADQHEVDCQWSGNWPLSLEITIETAENGGFIGTIPGLGCRAVGETLTATIAALSDAVDVKIGPADVRSPTEIEIDDLRGYLGNNVVRLLRLETLDAPLVIMANELRVIGERVERLAALKAGRE